MPLPAPSPATRRPVPFVHRLAAHGTAVALVEDGVATTYRDLADAVAARAGTLGDGRRLVLLVAEPSRESVVTYLAALSAGHVVLLAPGDRPGTVAALRERYRPDVVAEGGASSPQVLHEAPQHDLHPELALLLSTSGSTGSPKLVRLSHDNLASNAEAVAASLELTADDVGVTSLPLSYCYGLSVLHSHLAVGASVLLTRLSVVDPCFRQAARAAGVTSLPGVPYTFDLLDRVGHEVLDLPSLRLVTQAGGRLAPERVRALAERGRRAGFDLVVMYGQTEATARMTYLPPGLAAEHPHSVGLPVPGGRVRVDPVPGAGEDGVGELVFEGPGVMLGYAERAADLALGRTVRELRTGDLARVDDDGLVEIVGRATRFAKVFGMRIDLDHAEALLARHGFVTSAVELDGSVLVAVEGDHDTGWVARLTAEDLGLPRHAVSAVAVPSLPRGAAGKVDAAAVRALAPAPPAAGAAAAADGDQEADVRALFAEVLERPDATPSDTFVGLGGDSLSYVAVSVQLERVLGHLPDAWHVTPIERLQPRRRRFRWVRQVETGVLLRAVAAVLIVATHVGVLAVPGSAHVLLALAGYNFARFRLDDRPRGDRVRGTLLSVARVALPSALWIALAALLVTDAYGPLNVLLVNHVLGTPTWDTSWHFWFVEVLVWTLVGVTLLVAVPAVDRLERRAPFALALAVLGAGLTARFELLPVDPVHPQPVLWLFGLGWAAARAVRWWQRAAVTAAAVLCVPGFFGDPQRDAVILVGVLLVLWVPRLPVPAPLAPLLATLAGASLFVYLTHWQVYPYLRPVDPWLAVGASLLVGVLYARVGGALTGAVERRAAQLVGRLRDPERADRPRAASSAPAAVPTTSATASRQSPVRSGSR